VRQWSWISVSSSLPGGYDESELLPSQLAKSVSHALKRNTLTRSWSFAGWSQSGEGVRNPTEVPLC
jgi:hypothetical protein